MYFAPERLHVNSNKYLYLYLFENDIYGGMPPKCETISNQKMNWKCMRTLPR